MINITDYHIKNQVHNLPKREDYNLFANNNRFLLGAILVSPGIVEISFSEELVLKTREIELWRWNYDSIDKFGNFGKIFIESHPIKTAAAKVNFNIPNWDYTLNYAIKYAEEWTSVFINPEVDGILDTYFNASAEEELGVRLKDGSAKFKVWSPPAAQINVLLFDKNQIPIHPNSPFTMRKAENGIFSLTIEPELIPNINSLDGLYYQYLVFAYGKATLALDPYCFSMASFNPSEKDKIGKGAIINMNDTQSLPEKFIKNYSNNEFMANETDLIAYEIHIRDFTIQPGSVKSKLAGTYLGAIAKIDHLKKLGISHIQLLPVMNFYTVNENDRLFSSSDALHSNYNWGYDPHHYFSLEGWFCSDAQNPYTRIREFRTLVQSLHDNGIGLILDVVYNHTYIVENFENIAPGCYYRLDSEHKISGTTGAGFTIESRRQMARKLILDSLKFFINSYHIDGFRFDLMGFMDHETIRIIRKEAGSAYNPENPNELILHGEGWVFSDLETSTESSNKNAATTKIHHPSENLNIGIFNDTCRDSFAGTPHTTGYILGNFNEIERVATVTIGGLKGFNPGAVSFNNHVFRNKYNLFAYYPSNCLNFLSIHDGMTLWDKINLHCSDSSGRQRARIMRMASAMLFTSQGKIILHGGDEILRTKPLSIVDKEQNRAFTSRHTTEEEGSFYFHENTYCSNDFTNMIRWSRLNNQYAPIARQMTDYYRGLILMRRSIPALRLKKRESIQKGIKFIPSSTTTKMEIPAVFSDFKDENLKQLTLKFIHGTANVNCFLAGEIHPKGIEINPTENPFIVRFNPSGEGMISFNRTQIEQFDLGKWGDGISLNFKLVFTPGGWETLPSSYNTEGKNVVMIQGIPQNGEVTIDLAIENHWVGITPKREEQWIAYMIDNTVEKEVAPQIQRADFTQLLIVHNAADVTSEIPVEQLENPSEWHVIMDSINAGITPLTYSPKPSFGQTDVLISKGKILIPAKSSAAIGRQTLQLKEGG